MQFPVSFLAALTVGIQLVDASFLLLTDGPLPTPTRAFKDSKESASYMLSMYSDLLNKDLEWVTKQDQTKLVAITSAIGAIDDFVATATQFDIPSVVTAAYSETTYTTVPNWYKALPSDVKAEYEKYNDAVVSIASKVLAGAAPTGAAGFGAGLAVAAAAGAAALL